MQSPELTDEQRETIFSWSDFLYDQCCDENKETITVGSIQEQMIKVEEKLTMLRAKTCCPPVEDCMKKKHEVLYFRVFQSMEDTDWEAFALSKLYGWAAQNHKDDGLTKQNIRNVQQSSELI